ncbi:DUF3991 domain-containing protein [Pediococcus pentosaceus]|uniref:DUF3991 and toprim domain-containing protein n=1 Tax=Pediococcus pentosaceus TaxID=1255 RepID=UPI0021A8FADE|nr:DUF3991 and toprim domain-containing protein [Pediococcus pentosaceus]MCT3019881.1 DUF3991 domain-containing protein [Pediococcus pentosaceus]
MEVKNEILNFMDYAGINYKIEGHEAYTVVHDSLKIPLKPGKSYFNWYSQGKWGHLPEFVMNFEGDGFKPAPNKREAFKLIKEFRQSKGAKRKRDIEYSGGETKKFDFATINQETAPWRSMEYLYEKRGLEPKFIKSLFESGLLAEEKQHHNILFLWRDAKNHKIGADVQGTVKQEGKKRPYLKMIKPGSAHNYGFSFNYGSRLAADKLVITEAPIDALSYFQSFGKELPNTVFTSISGSSTKIDSIDNLIDQTIIQQGNQLKELHIAVDNDEAGQNTIKKLQEPEWRDKHPFNIIVDIPKFGKDWNEQVQDKRIDKYSIPLDDYRASKFPMLKTSPTKKRDRQREKSPEVPFAARPSKAIKR